MKILDGSGRPYDSVPRLIALIEQGAEPSRSEAVAEALERADPRTLPVLAAEIRAGRLSARHLSIFKSAAVPLVTELLQDGRPVVRRHAAEVLVEIPDAQSEEALARCATDRAFVVRWAAARALQALKGGSPAWKRTCKRLHIGKYLEREWLPDKPFCFNCGSWMTAHGEPFVESKGKYLHELAFSEREDVEFWVSFPDPGTFGGSYCDPCGMVYCERCSRTGACGYCGEAASADPITGNRSIHGIARRTMDRFA